MNFKKAISPVIATALLLVVAVVAVSSFQNFFGSFSSGLFTKVEQQSNIENILKVEDLTGNILYLKIGSNTNLTLLKITDDSGNTMCSFSGNTSVDQAGLLGWWTFDDIINQSGSLILPDMSGNGNNGTLYDANISNTDSNTTPQLVSSKLGNALEFDGVDDYVSFSNSIIKNKTFTIYTLVKAIGIGGGLVNDNVIFEQRVDGLGNNNPAILLTGGLNSLGVVRSSSGTAEELDFFSNNYNVQESYVFRVNETDMSIFVNNLLTNSSTVNQLGSYDVGIVYTDFGRHRYNGGNAGFFNGELDEVRIYNRTLTDAEIKQLYWYSIQSQQIGINEIDVSSCNLTYGQIYNVIVFSNINKVEQKLIAK